jgi:ribose 5-phosphate isomerase A
MTTSNRSAADSRKAAAAQAAADLVESGMVLGLGTGATATFLLLELAARIQSGKLSHIRGVPTSSRTEALARELAIPLTTLEEDPILDLAIDGADEIDPQGNVIKGGGGALLREKIVAQSAKVFVIVAEAGKCSPRLGTVWALPVEVIPFGWRTQADYLAAFGAEVVLRMDGTTPFHTDSGNYILDARFAPRDSWRAIAAALESRAGIVEHGLFLRMAHHLFIADDDAVTHLTPEL